MNLSEQNQCFELPLEVHEHPKSCSHSECGSDLPTSDAEHEKAASNHVIDVSDEVVEASKAEPEMREVKMDVDVDACERPTTRKKFLETNDQTFAFCGSKSSFFFTENNFYLSDFEQKVTPLFNHSFGFIGRYKL